jgi:hypothetical protein
MKTPTLKQKLDELANYAADDLLEAYGSGDMTDVFHATGRAKGTGEFLGHASTYIEVSRIMEQ